MDRLRYIEAILFDEVKSLYRMSQNILNYSELDSRNSVTQLVVFYDKVTELLMTPKFNLYVKFFLICMMITLLPSN